jgi:hypothetical protein
LSWLTSIRGGTLLLRQSVETLENQCQAAAVSGFQRTSFCRPQAFLCLLQSEKERQILRAHLCQLLDEFRRSPIRGRAPYSARVSHSAISDALDHPPVMFSSRTYLVQYIAVVLRVQRVA